MEELNLKELFNTFWTRKVDMIIIVLVFFIVGTIYSYIFVEPEYKAYTTLVLAKVGEDTGLGNTITTTDISLNNNLVATYSELIKSKTVLRKVINNLGIKRTESVLKNNVSVSAIKNTQLIQINVVDKEAKEAKIIANEMAKVFKDKVEEIYNINNIYVVDEAETPTIPYNINHTKDIIMFTFVGIVISCIYVLIANMLDNTVKSKEEVENKLGLTVLVTIPLCDFDYEVSKSMKSGGR